MSITFRHKIKRQAIFYNDLVPGRSTPGPNGLGGNKGANGPSIYFSDYTPDDDYVKKMLLDKISHGLFLTSDSSQKLIGISYTPGDLIITEKKYIYKLILNNGEYDLKFLGQFVSRDNSEEEEEKVLLDNLVSVEINNLQKREQPVPVPTNRGMESDSSLSTETIIYELKVPGGQRVPNYETTDSCTNADITFSYEESLKRAFGFDFYPIVRIEDGSNIADDYEFYLNIKIKNYKSPQLGAYTLEDSDTLNFIDPTSKDPAPENLYNSFMFYKSSELKLKVYGIDQNPPIDSSTYKTEDGFTRCSITEMTCDKLHPSGNNIASNIVMSGYKYKDNDSSAIPGAINDLSVSGYIYLPLDSSYNGKPGSVRRTYKSSGEIFDDDKEMFRSSSYKNTLGFLQYSKRDGEHSELVPNFRGGDSAFFSGIVKESYDSSMFHKNINADYVTSHISYTNVSSKTPYYNFAHHVNCMTHSFQGDDIDSDYRSLRFESERRYVTDQWMIPFYFGKDNIYELICVNKHTGETYRLYPRKVVIS